MKLIPLILALVVPFQTEGIEDLLKVDQALRGRDFKKAVKLADEAIAKNPKNERLHYFRGLANSGLHDYAAALKDFDNSLKINPKFYNALDQRGIGREVGFQARVVVAPRSEVARVRVGLA